MLRTTVCSNAPTRDCRRFAALASLLFVSSLASGCAGRPTRDDASNAGGDVKSVAAAQPSAGKAADGTTETTAKAPIDAANQKTAGAGAGDVVPGSAGKTQHLAELAGTKAAPASAEPAEAMALTAKVKSAILADKRVSIPALSVHTKLAAKHVIIGGVTPLAAVRDAAIEDATKEIAKENAGFTIINNIEVGKPRPF